MALLESPDPASVIVSRESPALVTVTAARRGRLPALARRYAGLLLLCPLVVLLIAVVGSVYSQFDGMRGLDYGGNLDYVRYIDFTGLLPLATRGWQMYHPPAYFLSTVVLFEAVHRLGGTLTMTDAGRWLATAAWIAEGAVVVVAVRAWRGSWLGAAVAAAIVWLLPGQAMVGSMLYNETLTDLGVGLVVLGIALYRHSRPWALTLLAIGIPLAALSKYSGLVAAGIGLIYLVWQERHRLWPSLLALAPGAIAIAFVYGRNLRHLGTPLPLNAIIFKLQSWDPVGWGHPAGFFTRIDLASCSAPHSFVGGLWKWFFATDCFNLPPWPSTLSPLLLAGALLVTAAIIAALVWLVLEFRADMCRLVLVAIPLAVLVAFVLYVLAVPSATTDKGVYTLSAVVPLAVAAGLFISRVARGRIATVGAYALLLGWSLVMANASGVL